MIDKKYPFSRLKAHFDRGTKCPSVLIKAGIIYLYDSTAIPSCRSHAAALAKRKKTSKKRRKNKKSSHFYKIRFRDCQKNCVYTTLNHDFNQFYIQKTLPKHPKMHKLKNQKPF
jgi:hypothetical protein